MQEQSQSYFIVYPNTQTHIPELELIELQGELETRPIKETLSDKQFGSIEDVGAKVQLIMDRQLLEGKKVVLKKPFVLFKKLQRENSNAYEVYAIIKSKIVFSQRPTPLSPSSSPSKKRGQDSRKSFEIVPGENLFK